MSDKLIPDALQAQAFINLLAPTGIVTFQTFDDNKDSKNKSLACVYHGTLQQHLASLTRLQQQGAGVFMMVNEGDGLVNAGSKTCRTASNVIKIRALFVDLDGAPMEPLINAPLPPHILVESSPGKGHGYWLNNDCQLDQFKSRQQALADRFSGDQSVCDLPRVMRLPGFYHLKAATPFQSRLLKPSI